MYNARKVLLDWKSYAEDFYRAHGGHQVLYGGRQLFRDGWRYALDHRGPEWAPPSDPYERAYLIHAYWTLARKRIAAKLYPLRESVTNLQEMQRARSRPLRAITISWDAAEKKMVDNRMQDGSARELDMEAFLLDLEAYEDGMIEAEECLAALEAEYPALKGQKHAEPAQ